VSRAEHTHHKTTAWSSSLFEQHLLVHNHGAIRHLLLLLLCWSGAAEMAQIIYLHWYIDARTPLAGCFGKHAAATVSLPAIKFCTQSTKCVLGESREGLAIHFCEKPFIITSQKRPLASFLWK
jgi:hypothetical protein